jgi:hypothetical protein
MNAFFSQISRMNGAVRASAAAVLTSARQAAARER